MTTETTAATPSTSQTVASDLTLASEAATVGAVASGNVALVPAIATATQLAQMLNSSLALVQSGHITSAEWSGVQTAFAAAVGRWNAA